MHYIEDRYSHAKVHNELLKAKSVVIMGGTFEAFTIAQAARTYLDDVGKYHTKVTVISNSMTDIRLSLGEGFEKYLSVLLKHQRISFLPNVQI